MSTQGELRFKRDKNGQLRGGSREGAGRPPKGKGASERHQVREAFKASQPIHVVSRILPRVGSLRRRDLYHAIRYATITAAIRGDIRIVHLSIQQKHLHLVVEAPDRLTLGTGMQSFLISAAKLINGALGTRTRRKVRGSVFGDRYHATVLRYPQQVRHTIAYVLNNWRHHGEDRGHTWQIDPFSSGISFFGWQELEGSPIAWRPPPMYESLFVWLPKTWLLASGWQRYGLVGAREIPGRARAVPHKP